MFFATFVTSKFFNSSILKFSIIFKFKLCDISLTSGHIMGLSFSSYSTSSGHLKIDMDSLKAQFVKEQINDNKVMIFSKSHCPYCVMAKEQFEKLNFPFFAIELNHRDDGDEIQNILAELTGSRTVPRVFVNGKCVGGGTDVKSMYQDGSLQKLLQ